MHKIYSVLLILLFPLSAYLDYSFSNSKINYEKLYKAGVEAYLENRWGACVSLIEKSIEDYIYYNSALILCRRKCQKNDSNIFSSSDESAVLWQIQTVFIKKALCLMTCQKTFFLKRPRSSKETDDEFEKKTPYNYLQLCYFKLEEVEKAASCAYTFLIHNPSHEVMQANLKYYLAIPGINSDKVKYLEPKAYQDLFLRGAQLYTDEKYSESLETMEVSLKEYLSADEECRLQCEGTMPELVNEEFYIAISNHLAFALKCKLNCGEKLSFVYGQKLDHIFSNHYHYLQFNYYKTGKLKEACAAVASFLLFYPEDKTMLKNKEFYSDLDGIFLKWFSPRKEAQDYYDQYKKESELLKFIEKSFTFDNPNKESSQFPTPPPGSAPSFMIQSPKKLGPIRSKFDSIQWEKENRINLVMDSKDLNGTKRAVLANVASEEECQKLMNLTLKGGVYGDGYNGKESPHTEFEMFEGLTVSRAATLSQQGIVDPSLAQLFLNISERARKAVESHFDTETELFFSYTHLVCRTALPESPEERTDLSHPIHADNCILTESGQCLKEKPAYTWRDYSSILYLNEGFEGGEFIFTKDKRTLQATVKPKCGQMVAFSAGQENLHGVKAIRKGRRCALAMWYTLDSFHREREREFANLLLSDLIHRQKAISSPNSISLFTLQKFAEKTSNMHHHSEL